MILILTFSGSVGIKLTYSAGILIGIQNSSCVPFLNGVTTQSRRKVIGKGSENALFWHFVSLFMEKLTEYQKDSFSEPYSSILYGALHGVPECCTAPHGHWTESLVPNIAPAKTFNWGCRNVDQLHRGFVCSVERMVKNWGPRLRVALCCTAFLPFYRLTFLQALFFLTVRRFVSERVKNR